MIGDAEERFGSSPAPPCENEGDDRAPAAALGIARVAGRA